MVEDNEYVGTIQNKAVQHSVHRMAGMRRVFGVVLSFGSFLVPSLFLPIRR